MAAAKKKSGATKRPVRTATRAAGGSDLARSRACVAILGWAHAFAEALEREVTYRRVQVSAIQASRFLLLAALSACHYGMASPKTCRAKWVEARPNPDAYERCMDIYRAKETKREARAERVRERNRARQPQIIVIQQPVAQGTHNCTTNADGTLTCAPLAPTVAPYPASSEVPTVGDR